MFVTLMLIRITIGLIWDTFLVEFGVFGPLLCEISSNAGLWVSPGRLLDHFWCPNGALGFLVDGIRLASILIWTAKVDKIVRNCRKVSTKNMTKEMNLKKYTSGPSSMSKSMVSSKRNTWFQKSCVSPKCHQNGRQMGPKCLQNRPESAKRPPRESQKVPKDSTEG